MSNNEQKEKDHKPQDDKKDDKKAEGSGSKPAYKGNNPGGASSKK